MSLLSFLLAGYCKGMLNGLWKKSITHAYFIDQSKSLKQETPAKTML